MTYGTYDIGSVNRSQRIVAELQRPVSLCDYDNVIRKTVIPVLSAILIVCWRAVSAVGDEATGIPKEVCVVGDPLISEASGVAVSRTTKDAVWMHNDSGDVPRLFLVGLNGTTLGIVNVKGVTAMDWEDMCSFELDGESWLLVGDIGDNGRVRGVTPSPGERGGISPPVRNGSGRVRSSTPPCQLLLLKEPTLKLTSQADPNFESTVDVFRTVEFQFPDGPHDCESLAVDTVSRTILLVTKTSPFNSALYSLPLTLTKGKESLKAERIASLGVAFATAMDISSDGRRLAIVNMFSGVMLTREDPKKESWAEAGSKPVTVLTLPIRKQGESVCFTADGNSLLLNSEGASQPLWQTELESRR